MKNPFYDSSPDPKTIQRLLDVFPSFALLAGVQLDVFTPLKDGPMAAERIAEAIGVRVEKLKPLLYALVAAGLLSLEGNRFANTDEAGRYLVRNSPYYIGDECEIYADLWHAALHTAASIRTGQPQARHDYTKMSRAEMETFFRALHPNCVKTGRALAASYDFADCQTLLDIGCGSGGLAIAFTEMYPHIAATVVDLPTVTPVTQRFVAEAGATERIQIASANVVEQSLSGRFDAAVLKAFLQVLSPGDARQTLKNVYASMNPGGKIYIMGAGILDNSRISPPELATLNIVFLNIYEEGQAYTEQEYHDWLIEAGFNDFRRERLVDGSTVIVARKPEE
jgi:SAM-dependent methyltransferase